MVKHREEVVVALPKLVTGKLDDQVSEKTPIIVTHDGRFHCDDALAVGLLLTLPEYAQAIVVRTRSQELIDRGTVVVDVGGVYDPTKLRFDHHQRGFNVCFDPDWRQVTKMSSAGMVFKHFGSRIIEQVFKVPTQYVDALMKKLYESLLESVDAIDNGVNQCPNNMEPLYVVRSDLSSRVARLNEEWNEWTDDYVSAKDFTKAVRITMEEFVDHVRGLRDAWLPARVIVETGLKTRFETHPSGRVIELSIGCPFEDHLEELEAMQGKNVSLNESPACSLQPPGLILFTIYPNTNDKTSWRVKAVKASRSKFGNRLDLPERLAGCRDGTATELGFPGVQFVHHAKFLAGCSTREACLLLVNKTLEEANIIMAA